MDYIKVTFRIEPLQPAREILLAELGEMEYESFVETESGLEAYIQKPFFSEDHLDKLTARSMDGVTVEHEWEEVPEQNWNAAWEENFTPIDVDGICYIRAPFHKPAESDSLEIIIQPQMSFGTGHHATTFLMARKMMALDLKGKRVLDMGCGTGVLAILAEKQGAKSVWAVDIDHWSFENTKENAKLNNCQDIQIREGGVEQIGDEKFDLVAANINRNVLLKDLKDYNSALNPGGVLLLSGFFTVDNPLLEKECTALGLKKVSEEQKETWSLLHFEK